MRLFQQHDDSIDVLSVLNCDATATGTSASVPSLLRHACSSHQSPFLAQPPAPCFAATDERGWGVRISMRPFSVPETSRRQLRHPEIWRKNLRSLFKRLPFADRLRWRRWLSFVDGNRRWRTMVKDGRRPDWCRSRRPPAAHRGMSTGCRRGNSGRLRGPRGVYVTPASRAW